MVFGVNSLFFDGLNMMVYCCCFKINWNWINLWFWANFYFSKAWYNFPWNVIYVITNQIVLSTIVFYTDHTNAWKRKWFTMAYSKRVIPVTTIYIIKPTYVAYSPHKSANITNNSGVSILLSHVVTFCLYTVNKNALNRPVSIKDTIKIASVIKHQYFIIYFPIKSMFFFAFWYSLE